MSRQNYWQSHWLDLEYDGLPLRDWCTKSTKEQEGFAHCKVCNLTLKYLNIGVRALRDHGKSKRHLENVKTVGAFSNSKSISASSVPSPVTCAKQKGVPHGLNTKSTTCFDHQKDQRNNLIKKNSYLKPHRHQEIDTNFGNIPYYQVSSYEARNALIPVYPCCYCPEEFMSKQQLHEHQVSCIMKPPVLQAVIPSEHDSMPQTFSDSPPSISPLSKSGSPLNANTELSFNYSTHVQPLKKDFISGLGLLPKKKAQQISLKRRNTECESIDWEEEIPQTPTTPGRTPKLLISHLSRDGHEYRRRRLSFNVDGKGDAMKDNEAEDEEADNQERKMTVTKSLYNLDVTSPIGQFVIKHFKGDPSLHILSDIESHCLTSSSPSKSSSISRLRVRHSVYPVTFRGYSGKNNGDFIHQYKFEREDVKEFMRRVNTGLNKASRHLYRQMKSCKVILRNVTKADLKRWIPSQNNLTVDLKPLSAAEIAFWTMPKPPPSLDSVSVFPNGLKFTSPNVNSILGLRTGQDRLNNRLQKSSLNLSNYVSEETCAELIQNRKVLYRSLLTDCSNRESPPRPSLSHSLLRKMLNQSPLVTTESKQMDFSTPCDKVTNNSSNNSNGTMRKRLFGSVSVESSVNSLISEKRQKCLGDFSVDVRTAKEGDEIQTSLPLTGRSMELGTNKNNSFNGDFSDSKRGISSDPCKVNGLSPSLSRNLRSSVLPLSKHLHKVDMKFKGRSLCLRNRNSVEQMSLHGNSKRRKMLVPKNHVKNNSTKDAILEQKRTTVQPSKPHHVVSNKRRQGLRAGNIQHMRHRSQRKSSSDTTSLFQRRLQAAGLVSREPSLPSISAPHDSGVETKPASVAVPNKCSRTRSRSLTATVSSSNVSNGVSDANPLTASNGPETVLKKSNSVTDTATVLKKSRSHPSACSISKSKRYHHQRRSKRRINDPRHKKFMLWLQSLRKGNIS